jgi:prepilin-type N-terminal cleavage/methylation domain-containing protein
MKRRGFSLIEVLCWLMLLSAAALIGTRLFTSLMRVFREAPAQQEAMIRFDSAIQTLREDVTASAVFANGADGKILLTSGYQPGNSIAWSIDGDDLLRKTGDDVRRWIGAGKNTAMSIDGPCIVLHLNGKYPEEIRLLSHIQLAGRMR